MHTTFVYAPFNCEFRAMLDDATINGDERNMAERVIDIYTSCLCDHYFYVLKVALQQKQQKSPGSFLCVCVVRMPQYKPYSRVKNA